MKRQRRSVRVITYPVDGIYTDKTVVAVIGGSAGHGRERPIVRLREVVHGRYRLVERMSGEGLEDGLQPPPHDKVFINPSDFTYHFLKRV
jgi:hypothetical protein